MSSVEFIDRYVELSRHSVPADTVLIVQGSRSSAITVLHSGMAELLINGATAVSDDRCRPGSLAARRGPSRSCRRLFRKRGTAAICQSTANHCTASWKRGTRTACEKAYSSLRAARDVLRRAASRYLKICAGIWRCCRCSRGRFAEPATGHAVAVTPPVVDLAQPEARDTPGQGRWLRSRCTEQR